MTWDHVISPEETEAIIGEAGGVPRGEGLQGRALVPRARHLGDGDHQCRRRASWSRWRSCSAYKPTIFITGRQHANEVSSTSHILRLAELLATDPAYKEILKKVNVIMHPVENPDGAPMAYELQKLTPTHMLHAGRYSALGMDVASQVGLPDPLLPESLVRGRVWRDWLPDIYLNPHGYPSHEWVQQFAGYVPPGFRTYWSTRGWYTQHRHAARSALSGSRRGDRGPARGASSARSTSNTDVRAMNLRHQARYRKWAYGFAPYVFNQEIYKDTAIYFTRSGERRAARQPPVRRGPRRRWRRRWSGGGTDACR